MGSTPYPRCRHSVRRDHPHIHGEHIMYDVFKVVNWGSPPYTWGAPTRLFSGSTFQRITPIYMGSTVIVFGVQFVGRDHPHIHGEHGYLRAVVAGLVGSPPYTWGALQSTVHDQGETRITPIYMGSTAAWFVSVNWSKDHPHIHGEH